MTVASLTWLRSRFHVALSPSLSTTFITQTIYKEIEKLKSENCDKTLVIVNRYDGIDLPDDSCRILVFDSRPYSDNLAERYDARCRPSSIMTIVRSTRAIEQGLGRSVRGEKDYCAILIIGPELVRMVRSTSNRNFFSKQTQAQIQIGLEIADLAQQEVASHTPLETMHSLIRQCVTRDEGWKAFYAEKMNALPPNGGADNHTLEIYRAELEAELQFQGGDPQNAVKTIQRLIDRFIKDEADIGWYLQEIARLSLPISKAQADKLQLEAHKKNRYLIKPATGMIVSQLPVSVARMENIIAWIRACGTFEQLNNSIQDVTGALQFGVGANRFERAFDELGKALGFSTERPDQQWKAGPDNLWALEHGHYLLVECKSQVDIQRAEIVKDETGQMNNACAWFQNNYPGCQAARILIIPMNRVSQAAGFVEKVQIMRDKELKGLLKQTKEFFNEFRSLDWKSLTETKVQELVNLHRLTVKDIVENYSVKPK